MKPDKHIVLLTPGFAENEYDENCIPPIQSFIKVSTELYPRTSFSVICFQYPYHRKPYLWHHNKVYPAGGQGKTGLRRILTWFRVIIYFLNIRSKNKDITIHALWLTECYFIGLLLSKLFGFKLVATVMGQDAKKENRYMKVLRIFKADIICCSTFAAETLKRSHNVTCGKIIPFGVYEEEFSFEYSSQRKIDLIGVGNLGPIKRYNLFIKMVNELKNKIPDIYCEIIGEGEFKKALQEQILQSDLSENIKLTGGLKRAEVLTKMKTSKILLHTSTYEGQGYVYMEALASGAYVVSFDTGFIPQHEKTKICKTESEVSEAILTILKNDLDFNPVIPFSMKQTITAYHTCYGN